MTTSVVYFDLTDPYDNKKNEKERATKLFQTVGAQMQQFFDSAVTIVISRRPKHELPKNMVNRLGLKIWDYDKVFRFFKNLGEAVPDAPKDHHLSVMLNDEKLHGVADRDPNAKRDDFNYFRYPFYYVYDLRNIIKPVAVREWKVKDTKPDSKKPWPHLHDSSYGHSLFQADPTDMMDDRKVRKRRLRDEQNRQYRERLRLVYSKSNTRQYIHDGFEMDSEEDTTIHAHGQIEPTNDELNMPPPDTNFQDFQRPLAITRQHSFIQNKYIEPTQRDGFEIQASGYNGSVSTQSADSQLTKNGLAPSGSTVSSKQVNTLQRKIIERKKISSQQSQQQPQQAQQSQQTSGTKPKVPGYCENCKIHFDDFDEHIIGVKHREFAQDPDNFEDIDDLIKALRQRVKNKQ
jgi:regulatory subunit for Cdc7p protein kinase